MARLNCVVRGVGESPFRGGAAPEGRGQTVQEGGERDGRDGRRCRFAEKTVRRLDAPELLADVASGLVYICKARREEGRRLISFTHFLTEPRVIALATPIALDAIYFPCNVVASRAKDSYGCDWILSRSVHSFRKAK